MVRGKQLAAKPKAMGPTTRRVTAQRKFAQGAFVPPAASAAPASPFTTAAVATPSTSAGPSERRHHPDLGNETNTFRSHMTAPVLLDLISFPSSVIEPQNLEQNNTLSPRPNVSDVATEYNDTINEETQPIVLVERLQKKGQGNKKSKKRKANSQKTRRGETEPRAGAVQPLAKKNRGRSIERRTHSMRLRCRDLIRRPCRLTPAEFSVKRNSSAKRSNCAKSARARYLIDRSFPQPGDEHEDHPLLVVQIKNKKYRRVEKTKFTLDDCRPLTFYAKKKKTQKAPAATPASAAPAPPATPATPATPAPAFECQRRADIRIPSIHIVSTYTCKEEDIIKSELNDETAAAYEDEIGDDAIIVNNIVNPANDATTDSNDEDYAINPEQASQHYSSLSIQNWINSSHQSDAGPSQFDQPGPSHLSQHASSAGQKTSRPAAIPVKHLRPAVILEKNLRPATNNKQNTCPAASWVFLRQVVEAPPHIYNRICRKCHICIVIGKIIVLSQLLIAHQEFKGELDRVNEKLSRSPSRAQSECGYLDETETIIIDLIPPHDRFKMKLITKRENDRANLSGSLVLRSDVTVDTDFPLLHQKEYLETLILNITLSLGKPPPSDIGEAPPSVVNKPVSRPTTTGGTSRYVDDQPGPSRGRRDEVVDIMQTIEYFPTVEEFANPLAYIKKIWVEASRYGICKIIPPEGFVPPCRADDDLRFGVTNQYITRLYNRWGPAAREMACIKECLRQQKINASRPPQIEGVEVNLPKLYRLVQSHGGLQSVINDNLWGRVAEDMKLCRSPCNERKLDQIYVKFLLPYDTMSQKEHLELLMKVERQWHSQHSKLLARAKNPLHRQNRILNGAVGPAPDDDDDPDEEPEDVVKRGANMNLAKFKKVARNVFDVIFKNRHSSSVHIEDEFWNSLVTGSDHICVNSASVDTGVEGHGFSKNQNDEYCRHPWNLKMISKNPMNMLRSLGPVLGVTVPTLHLGMVFSTSCWHKDPHSIAWMEYLHTGTSKIWYSIPASEEKKFREAAETLIPSTCQNKALWLPSDVAMIPPSLLRDRNVKVHRVEQKPGEFIVIMPRAYSSSISTGYTVSESVYFATDNWFDSIMNVFQEIRKSCEPTTFSIEQLLIAIAEDESAPASVMTKIKPALQQILTQEMEYRRLLTMSGVRLANTDQTERATTSRGKNRKRDIETPIPPPTPVPGSVPGTSFAPPQPPVYNVREHDECEICRCTLLLSKVKNIPEKDSVVCLEHAVKLLRVMNNDPEWSPVEVEMFHMYESARLQKLIGALDWQAEMAAYAAGDDGGSSEA